MSKSSDGARLAYADCICLSPSMRLSECTRFSPSEICSLSTAWQITPPFYDYMVRLTRSVDCYYELSSTCTYCARKTGLPVGVPARYPKPWRCNNQTNITRYLISLWSALFRINPLRLDYNHCYKLGSYY